MYQTDPNSFTNCTISLRAVDRARNIARAYRIEAARDLFGHIIVEQSWGRIGARQRRIARSFASSEEALRHIAGLMSRRATAQRRIGTPYMSVTKA